MLRQRLGKVVVVVVVAVLLVAYVVAARLTGCLNRDICLDSGRVWDSRDSRCYDGDEGT